MIGAPKRTQLRAAYEAARYRVDLQGLAITLRIAHVLPAPLAQFLQSTGHKQAALLSAANPLSSLLDRHTNEIRHQQLLALLKDQGIEWLRASGEADDGLWDAEISVLALGLCQSQAIAIAEHFEQNAYVQLLQDECPQLVLTRYGHDNL